MVKQKTIEKYLFRFNEILKERKIDFKFQDDFEKYYKLANTKEEILDVYSKVLLDLRKYEEENL